MEQRPSGPALGLPLWLVLGLAALAVPRVVVHDLDVTLGPPVQALLALGPPVVWVLVAIRLRVPSPVLTLVAVGCLYGCALAVAHNLMWDSAFAGNTPELGGALAGELEDGTEETFLRVAASVSSVFTGMVLGLISGLVATGIRQLTVRRGRAPRGQSEMR